ncbi:hypothetical protein VCHE45_0957 [Vibrio cholerae HE-45]|nr:hypothetical protein VCHE45_0957 [Vibrio cholerae HE-45]
MVFYSSVLLKVFLMISLLENTLKFSQASYHDACGLMSVEYRVYCSLS